MLIEIWWRSFSAQDDPHISIGLPLSFDFGDGPERVPGRDVISLYPVHVTAKNIPYRSGGGHGATCDDPPTGVGDMSGVGL